MKTSNTTPLPPFLTADSDFSPIKENTCYFTVMEPGSSPKPLDGKEGAILDLLLEKKSICIITSPTSIVQPLLDLSTWRRRGAHAISLPDLDVPTLASLTLQEIEKAGYQLVQVRDAVYF